MQQTYPEHPEDVLSQWLDWHEAGPVALIVVTSIEGGAVHHGACAKTSPLSPPPLQPGPCPPPYFSDHNTF